MNDGIGFSGCDVANSTQTVFVFDKYVATVVDHDFLDPRIGQPVFERTAPTRDSNRVIGNGLSITNGKERSSVA